MRTEHGNISTTGSNGTEKTERKYTVWIADDEHANHLSVQMFLET